MNLPKNNYRRFTAIVPSAGSSSRMKGKNKILADLQGKPVIIRTLEVLASVPEIENIILVVSSSDLDGISNIMEKNPVPKLIKIVEGGKERHQSVYAGVAEADSEYLVIHDGARPLIDRELMQRLIEKTAEFDSVIPAIPVVDTIKRIDKQGMVLKTLDRNGLYLVQTPQIIKKETWLKAYDLFKTANTPATDDASILEIAGFPVKIVPGNTFNIKITTPDDLALAQVLFSFASGMSLSEKTGGS